MLDAIPLLRTDAAVTLMRDIIESGQLNDVTLDNWFASLAFYKNPTRAMITTSAVSTVYESVLIVCSLLLNFKIIILYICIVNVSQFELQKSQKQDWSFSWSIRFRISSKNKRKLLGIWNVPKISAKPKQIFSNHLKTCLTTNFSRNFLIRCCRRFKGIFGWLSSRIGSLGNLISRPNILRKPDQLSTATRSPGEHPTNLNHDFYTLYLSYLSYQCLFLVVTFI